MNFSFTSEEKELRTTVQNFLAEHYTDQVRAEYVAGRKGEGWGKAIREFYAKVNERRWFAWSWPVEYGGGGGTRTAQFIIEEEFFRTAGIQLGGGTGAPAILAFGTQDQKEEFVPPSIRREIIFCQGYSEPGCGTDLAGIRCRAQLIGDKYVINGQKIFTTNAQNATHIFLMVRTDPSSTRHRGLSILLVPMNLPGLAVRPLWTIQNNPPAPFGTTYGEERTNEVFFENVEVPVSSLLGEEGGGWEVARRGLNLDRVGAWRYLISVMRDEDIVNWLKSDDPLPLLLKDDPDVRNKIAEIWVEAEVCRLMTMRSISIEQRNENFSYEGSAEKVFAPEHSVRSTEAISQILGPYAQLMQGSPAAVEKGIFAHNLLGAFQSTVNHGSVQVMRDQIARNGLGLPRPKR
ncbi:acyl-CoA dehydrogenase family protein [Alcaligenaceae bacterium]|nr:acyl-CoA dehydrogenase family protein [Alcaligenaceae bacterium]